MRFSVISIVSVAVVGFGCLYEPSGKVTGSTEEPDSASTASSSSDSEPTSTGGATAATEPAMGTTMDETTGDMSSSAITSSSATSSTDASTGPASVCGDGVVEGVEECDDGMETVECDANCTYSMCGDGDFNAASGEICDHGPESALCDADCTPPLCGDGLVNFAAGESCDDGGVSPGDLCDGECISTEIVQVVAGARWTCVLFAGGNVRCWGENVAGQLGYGHTNGLGDMPGELPTPDVLVGGKVVQLAAGHSYVCALLETGSVRCWGENNNAELGDGTTKNRGDDPGEMPPVDVAVDDVAEISTGSDHTCIRTTGGKVRCWGAGAYGRLGYGNEDTVYSPGADVPGLDQVERISAGGRHTCALRDGEVYCWGHNATGQLGLGHTVNVGDKPGQTPDVAVNLGSPAIQLAAGNSHNCAIVQGGSVRCWGNGVALGNGTGQTIGDQPNEPATLVDLGGAAVRVEAGIDMTCALLVAGKVKCWGRGDLGALGYASTVDKGSKPGDMPTPDVDLGGDAALLLSGPARYSNCAALASGRLRCWGHNSDGQLGLGHTEIVGDDETPVMVAFVPF